MKSINSIVKHPLFSGSVILVVGSLGINAINLIYHFLMGKLLRPENYGVLLSLYSVLYILSVVPISSSVSIVKFISKAKDKHERLSVFNSVSRLIFYIATGGSILVVILSPAIAKFLNINDVLSTIFTAGVLFFSLITLVNQASLQGILQFNGVVAPNFISSLLKLLLGVLLVFLGFSVQGAMFAVVLGAAVAYFLSKKMVNKFFHGNSVSNFKIFPFLTYSGPVLVQAFAFTSLFTTDVILVKHFFAPLEAGWYAALSTLGKIVFFGASPVAAAMFPYVSGKHARGEKYIREFLAAFSLTVIISFGVVAVYALVPNLVINILYGHDYLPASDILVWMGLFVAFYTVANLFVNFFLSIDITKIVFLPFLMSLLQILLIWFYHDTLLQVIQISLVEMIILCASLGLFLGYNQFAKYEKGHKL